MIFSARRAIFLKLVKLPTAIRKLNSLNLEEIRLFRRFWQNSINKETLLAAGNDVLQKIAVASKEAELTFDVLFSDSILSDSQKNSVLHKLHEIFKLFVVEELSESDLTKSINEEIKLIEFYQKRKLFDFAESSIRKMESLINKYTYEDTHFFYHRFQYEEIRNRFLGLSLSEESSLQQENDALDVFFLSKKLRTCAFMINAQNISNVSYDYHLMDDVLKHLEKEPYKNIPTIYLWSNALRLMRDPGKLELFSKLEDSLKNCLHLISQENARNFFAVLENSLLRLKTQFSDYRRKLHELYMLQIEQKILPLEGHFPSMMFDNIVTVSLAVDGAQKTREFINSYIEFVSPESRKEKASYNLARCLFEEERLDECLLELNKIEKIKFHSIHQNLARRRLQIKTYYAIQVRDFDADPNQPERSIRALKKFLHVHKNEMAAVHERANLDFARFVNRLTEASGERKIGKLKQEIQETGLLPEKEWLLDQLTEL